MPGAWRAPLGEAPSGRNSAELVRDSARTPSNSHTSLSARGAVSRAAGKLLTNPSLRAGVDSSSESPSATSPTGPVSARGSRGQEDDGSFITGASAKHLRRQVTLLNEERSNFHKELETLRVGNKEQAVRLQRLEGEAKIAREAHESHSNRLHEAEHQAEVSRRKLEDMEGARRQLQDLLSQREAEIASLKEALESLRKESQESLEAALQDSKAEGAELRQKLSDAEGKLTDAEATGQRQREELEQVRERLGRAEQEATRENSRLDALLQGLVVESDTLRRDGEALKGENASLKGERDSLRQQAEALLSEKEALSARLEEALRLKEAEASRLVAALEEFRRLAEARRVEAEKRAAEVEASKKLASELEQRAQQLEVERAVASGQLNALRGDEAALRGELAKIVEQLEKERLAGSQRGALQREAELLRDRLIKQTQENFEMRRKMEEDMQQLLEAKMADAINQKVELHICVPRTSLTYNNAPPLFASVADGLTEDRIGEFLEREVFPHFEPLWARVDTLDSSPDGSSKRVYSKKMLDRLTEAVRKYIQKAQQSQARAAE